jgi:hypothetical protein
MKVSSIVMWLGMLVAGCIKSRRHEGRTPFARLFSLFVERIGRLTPKGVEGRGRLPAVVFA